MTDQIPVFRLLADRFFEPDLVGKGSVIEYDGVPDEKMEPLNEAAKARLSSWYHEEFPHLDDKTGLQLRDHEGKFLTHRPRLALRPLEQSPEGAPKPAGVRVVAKPAPAELNDKAAIAAMVNAPAKEWTRPGPVEIPEAGVKVLELEKPNATTASGAAVTAKSKD